MLSLILSSLIITSEPNQPTEIIGSANTPSGSQNEVIVKQPQNSPNPFGYIAPNYTQPNNNISKQTTPPNTSNSTKKSTPDQLITSQTSTISPKDMNPLDYKDKIENTIYQSGDRLIIIQSIPLKYIKEALEPNIQPTISDYPSW